MMQQTEKKKKVVIKTNADLSTLGDVPFQANESAPTLANLIGFNTHCNSSNQLKIA